jgi:predicted ester cyclase
LVTHGDAKSVVLEFYESWERGVIDFEALVHAEIVNHQPGAAPARGRDLFREAVTGVMTAVPDSRWTVSDILADGDRVSVRITWSGTYDGPRFRGVDIPGPKRFSVEHIHIYHVADGKLAEHWVVRDDLSMLYQLGALGD